MHITPASHYSLNNDEDDLFSDMDYYNTPYSETSECFIKVIYADQLPNLPWIKEIVKRTLQIGVGPLSYIATAPHVNIALSLKGITAIITTGGVVFNFGTLTYWGWIFFLEEVFRTPYLIRKQDFQFFSMLKKITTILLSIGLGTSSRLTSIGVVSLNNNLSPFEKVLAASMAMGVRSILNSCSLYKTLKETDDLVSKSFLSKNEKLVNRLKENMISTLQAITGKTLTLGDTDRKQKFNSFFEYHEKGNLETSGNLNKIFNEVIEFKKEIDNRPVQINFVDATLSPSLKKVAQGVGIAANTALLIQNFLLTRNAVYILLVFLSELFTGKKTTSEYLQSHPWVNFTVILFTLMATLTFFRVGYESTMTSAVTFVQKGIGSEDREKTFAEVFYPDLEYLLYVLNALSASLVIPEVAEVASHFGDSKTLLGRAFIWLNAASSFLLIVNSIKALYEVIIHKFSETRFAAKEKQRAALLMRKLINFEDFIKECLLPQLANLFRDLDNDHLKFIMNDPKISIEDIKEVLNKYHVKI